MKGLTAGLLIGAALGGWPNNVNAATYPFSTTLQGLISAGDDNNDLSYYLRATTRCYALTSVLYSIEAIDTRQSNNRYAAQLQYYTDSMRSLASGIMLTKNLSPDEADKLETNVRTDTFTYLQTYSGWVQSNSTTPDQWFNDEQAQCKRLSGE